MLRSIVFWTILILFVSLSAQEAVQPEKQEQQPAAEQEKAEKETNSPSMILEDGKPSKFFELYGYFAFAYKFTNNMILNGNNPYLTQTKIKGIDYGDSTTPAAPKASSKEKNLSWAWLKLHLEPVINVAEMLEIHTKMSLFGNTVLGADNVIADTKSNGIMRDAQLDTSANIIFEGLWGTVDTPIGELKLGRMPFNWGLGLLYNDGNRINDQSTGNYLDRIQLTIPVAGFKIIPAFDIASTGLLDGMRDYLIDSSMKDNGFNVSAMFMMNEDDPALLKNKLLNGKTVVEFGAMVMFSWKNDTSGEWDTTNNTYVPTFDKYADPAKTYVYEDQGAKLWKLDAWLKLHHRRFSLRTEIAFLTGSIGKMLLDDGTEKTVKNESVGFALEAEFRAIPDKFNLSLFTGIASPDDADYVQGDSWNNPGLAVNNDAANSDTKVQNFRFNRNYHFNSALWNQFLGRFTAGYYASLFGTYYIIEELKVDLGVTYSMALYKNNSLGGEGLPDAIEPFISIDYANKSGLRAGVQYQFGVPFDGLAVTVNNDKTEADFYHYLNIYLGIVF